MILRATIEKVMDTARIEEVVRSYVDLKNRGSNLIGLCPFHREKTPSFTVSPSRNIFKCFGCAKAGDPVRFVMEIEQLSFPKPSEVSPNVTTFPLKRPFRPKKTAAKHFCWKV